MGAMIGTGLYMLFSLVTGVIVPLAWVQRDTTEAKAFCKGTTETYRKGNDYGSFNKCHGSDICAGTDWDEVESTAMASWIYGVIMNIVTLLLLIGTMVLIVKKHAAGLKIAWKALAVMILLFLLEPIIQVGVSSKAQATRFHGNEYYIMAVKDTMCNFGTKIAGNEGILATYPSTKDTLAMEELRAETKDQAGIDKMCKDTKWVGAPDPTDDLKDSWGRDPCGDPPAFGGFVMPFLWYFVFYLGLYSYLIFNIWSLKEELAGAPKNDTEMGAAKPAVAVATATATAA
jgi:hypothetical protein